MEIPKPEGSFKSVIEPRTTSIRPSKLRDMLAGKKLNKKRIALIFSVVIALVFTVLFVAKIGPTSFTVKEEGNELPPCTNECEFEGKNCENGKIFECAIGEDGCRHKNLVESCPEGSICSTLNEGTCYTPQTCDFEFHTCMSTISYKLCKNGKTIEGAETKKCPENLVCNRSPKNFALCVEK